MNQNFTLAPVVLFVYNRYEHTKQTIEALQKNILAQESNLYIFSDGPKNDNAKESVHKVRNFIKDIDGFHNVTIIEREKNMGLADSIISGVTTTIEKYGKIIVLEDDLLTSKYFLEYMNNALLTYKNREDIYSITGFSFSTEFMNFPKEYQNDIYVNIRPMSWSWATWEDRWEGLDWEIKDFNEFITNSSLKKAFNKGGSDLTRMLNNQMKGVINSWYIRWTYNAYKQKKLTVYPRVSYVNNIGHDITGTHCVEESNDIYSHTQLNDKTATFNKEIELNADIVKHFNKGFNTNYIRILKRKLKKLIYNFQR